MFGKVFTVGAAVLLAAAPATAQQRGTMEFGAYAGSTSFDNSLGMNNSWSAGGRVGMFAFPRLSLEIEAGGGRSGRSFGLGTVNQFAVAGRLLGVPVKAGRVSVLLGAGAVHSDYQWEESFGFQALLGLKLAISEGVALRIDGVKDWNANPDYTSNMGIRAGLSFYRHPVGTTTTVTREVAGPPVAQRPDSVSAAETWRLRMLAASYQALRDSLARGPGYVPASSAAALATMKEMIYFENEKSVLSDSAKAVLDNKVVVFKANPAMRIVITGFASQPGTETYNFTLGRQRADAAKAYLVSQGVDPVRIEVSTKGEGQLVVEGPGEPADAENRRGQFRLLIADPYLAAPKK